MPDGGNPSPTASYLPIVLGPPLLLGGGLEGRGGGRGVRGAHQSKSNKLDCPIAAYLPITRLPIAIRIADCVLPIGCPMLSTGQ